MDEVEFIEEEGGFSEHHSLLCSATSEVMLYHLPFLGIFSNTILAFTQTFCSFYCWFFCRVSPSLLSSFAQKHLCHTNTYICDSNLKGHLPAPEHQLLLWTRHASVDDGAVAFIMSLDKEALLHFTLALNCFSNA